MKAGSKTAFSVLSGPRIALHDMDDHEIVDEFASDSNCRERLQPTRLPQPGQALQAEQYLEAARAAYVGVRAQPASRWTALLRFSTWEARFFVMDTRTTAGAKATAK